MRGKSKEIKLTAVMLIIASVFISSAIIKYNQTVLVEIESPNQLYSLSNGLVYFSRETCPNCILANKVLVPFLKKSDLKILYFNTDTWRDNPDFEKALSDFQVRQVPVLVKISNGEYVDSISLVHDGKAHSGLLYDFVSRNK